MPVQILTTNFLRALQDTANEDGLGFPGFTKFHDIRVSEGGAKRRKGMAPLDRAANNLKSIDLNGSSQYIDIPLDTRPTTLMGTKFTIEGLIAPDVVTGTNPIIDWGVTTPAFLVDTASSKLRVRIWDSSAALTTLTSSSDLPTTTVSFQVVRDGASLTLRMDNVVEDTGTMDATKLLRTPVGNIRLGYDGTDFFNGKLDYIRLLGVVRSDHIDDRLRFPDPRCQYVLYDADFNLTSDGHCIDRSRFGNTGLQVNSPSETTALAHQTAPVMAIHHTETRSGEGKLVTVAGQFIYAGTV